ncbi:putative primase [Staphylococcus aureus subsp. aureus 112808A]|nr:putative primase [Staphylococcus aureus subsp. aureus 112808A]
MSKSVLFFLRLSGSLPLKKQCNPVPLGDFSQYVSRIIFNANSELICPFSSIALSISRQTKLLPSLNTKPIPLYCSSTSYSILTLSKSHHVFYWLY